MPEPLLDLIDYWDGPIKGLCLIGGSLHYFECVDPDIYNDPVEHFGLLKLTGDDISTLEQLKKTGDWKRLPATPATRKFLDSLQHRVAANGSDIKVMRGEITLIEGRRVTGKYVADWIELDGS